MQDWFGLALGVAMATSPTQTVVVPELPSLDTGPVCISAFFPAFTIFVGERRRKMEIQFGGGACEPPGPGISTASLRYVSDKSNSDAVIAQNCPAFRARIDRLRSIMPRRQITTGADRPIQAGLLHILDHRHFSIFAPPLVARLPSDGYVRP